MPRVSPSGAFLSFIARGSADRLQMAAISPPSEPQSLLEHSIGPASWFPDNDRLAVNVQDSKPQVYEGQMYWPTAREKYCLNLERKALKAIDLPPPYVVFDVSRDGKSIAMHWDTHASLTGAQLYLADVDGNNVKVVAQKHFQYYWYPRFSPDGRFIVAKHLNANGGKATLRVLSLDGASERSISLGEQWSPEMACWSPDGRFLATAAFNAEAMSGSRKSSSIFVVDLEGTRLKEVKLPQADDLRIGSIDWTPAILIPE